MKKFILLFLIAFNLFAINVFASTETIEYQYTITDDHRWNLETGQIQEDYRFSITNRIIIKPSINNKITLDAPLFHHAVFFDRFNNYIGYYNSPYSILENDKYLGQITNNEISIPSGAYSFSFMLFKSGTDDVITDYNFPQPTTLNDLFFNGTIEYYLGINLIDELNQIDPFITDFNVYNNILDTYYFEFNGSASFETDFLKVNPNEIYNLTFVSIITDQTYLDPFDDTNITIYYYDINQNLISQNLYAIGNINHTIPNNIYYVKIEFNLSYFNEGIRNTFELQYLSYKDTQPRPLTIITNDLQVIGADFLTINELKNLYLEYLSFFDNSSVYSDLGYNSLKNVFENSNFLDANGETIIIGKSITFNDLLFTEYSDNNLFDYSDTTAERFINLSGNITANQNYLYYNASNFIKITPNTFYVATYNEAYDDSGITIGSYYDENFNFISTITIYNINVNYTNVYLSPSNAEYVRLNVQNNDIKNFKWELGTQATAYQAGRTPTQLANDLTNLLSLPSNPSIIDQILTINGDIFLQQNVGVVSSNQQYLHDLEGYSNNQLFNTNLNGQTLDEISEIKSYDGVSDSIETINGDIIKNNNVNRLFNADDSVDELNGDTLNDTFISEYNLDPYVEMDGLTLNNSVVNGDFSDNVNNWDKLSIQSEDLDLTNISNNSLYLNPINTRQTAFQEINSNTNDKIFVAGYIKKISRTTDALFYILPKNSASGSISIIMSQNQFETMPTNTWTLYSNIFNTTNDGFRIVIGRDFDNSNYELNADNIMAINMTALGIENYTEQQMLDLVRQGYFEGLQSVSNPEFTTTGKNLFNKDGNLGVGYISSNGTIEPFTNYSYTINPIRVQPNQTYAFSNIFTYAFYDRNDTFIEIVSGVSNLTYTTPTNAYYMRISIFNDNETIAQVENGNEYTFYEAYQQSTLDFNAGSGKNLLYGWQQGGIDDNGIETVDTQRIRTDFISVSSNTTYTFRSEILSAYLIAEYDVNNSFISLGVVGAIYPAGTSQTFTTTSTTAFVRLLIRKEPIVDINPANFIDFLPQLELGSTATTYQPYTYWDDTLNAKDNVNDHIYFDNGDFKLDKYFDVIYSNDQAIPELNGLTLNEVFNDGNLLSNSDFSNGTTDWIAFNSTFTVSDNIATFIGTSGISQGIYQSTSAVGTNSWYLVADIKSTSNLVRLDRGQSATIVGSQQYHTGSGNFETLSIKFSTSVIVSSSIRDLRTSDWDFVFVKNPKAINLSLLGISITKEQLDNYYEAYQALNNGDNFYLYELDTPLTLNLTELGLVNGSLTAFEYETNVLTTADAFINYSINNIPYQAVDKIEYFDSMDMRLDTLSNIINQYDLDRYYEMWYEYNFPLDVIVRDGLTLNDIFLNGNETINFDLNDPWTPGFSPNGWAITNPVDKVNIYDQEAHLISATYNETTNTISGSNIRQSFTANDGDRIYIAVQVFAYDAPANEKYLYITLQGNELFNTALTFTTPIYYRTDYIWDSSNPNVELRIGGIGAVVDKIYFINMTQLGFTGSSATMNQLLTRYLNPQPLPLDYVSSNPTTTNISELLDTYYDLDLTQETFETLYGFYNYFNSSGTKVNQLYALQNPRFKNISTILENYLNLDIYFEPWLYQWIDLYDSVINDTIYQNGLYQIGGYKFYTLNNEYVLSYNELNFNPSLTEPQILVYYQEYLDNLELESALYLNILSVGSLELANAGYLRNIPAPSELDTDAEGFLENVFLDNLGFNNTIGQTILSIAVIFGAVFLLASIGMPTSVLIGVSALLYVGLAIIGWVPAWITLVIVLAVLIMLFLRFKGNGGGSNETID